MRKLCCDRDLDACRTIQAILEGAGIACDVRHETTASLFGGKGITSEWPEVWIEDDDRFDEAWALLNGDLPDGEADSDPDDDDPDEPE